MAYWLVKSEPETWSWESHAKAATDAWTGVRNFQARAHLSAMRPGDEVLFYHSGEAKAVVGISKVVREAYVDPTDPTGKFVAVDLKAATPLERPVTLAEVKATPALADMVLVKNSRLSVQPVTASEWALILKMSKA
ncbi:MAG TPA: EVE domain-containing protein [Caulobacteraceae bacterium]|jgi:predicted RNA-binding protein with PUA-like domain|nr:EVE domain-containing protein [Caulobacteraceae bacterium]